MLQEIVLHDFVVLMGIDADVGVVGEAEVHNAGEDAMSLRVTGYSMDYMIRLDIIYPLTFVDFSISGFGGLKEGEIAYDLTVILYDKAAITFYVSHDSCL